jgi:uncharacterized protein (DUF433 family)
MLCCLMSTVITKLPVPLITRDPARLDGTAVFAGTRVPVQTLFDFLEDGAPLDEFLRGFPNVSKAHAVAVLELAKNAALSKLGSVAAE